MYVLVTSPFLGPADHQLLAPLTSIGATLAFSPYAGPRPLGELEGLLVRADAMVAGSDAITASMMAQAPLLKVIARVGVGYDAVDLTAAGQRGIAVTITPGANDQAVADYTLALILVLLRRVVENHAAMSAGRWQRAVGVDLAGKTVGIVGTGRIGKLVARRLSGFDARLLAYDVAPDAEFAKRSGARYLPLDELLAASDVVTLHVALNDQTFHLLDARRVSLLKRTAYVVNTCRGPVIEEAALVEALNAGRIAGAALDVFEQEPPRDRPILSARNVIVSPHVAGVSAEAAARMVSMAVADVARVLQGQPPLHPVPTV